MVENMLTNTVAYLLFIGLGALLRFRVKADKFVVPLITFATCFVFYLFCKDFQTGDEKITTLLWDSSRSGDIKIDIISSLNNCKIVLPFFIITLLALFNNLFFKYESNKREFAAILIFNLLSLIMLIAGNNLIQIITFVFVIDILSQLFIKDIYASRRYSIYNLVADMGLFLVMAMLKGKLETLEIGSVGHYYETGRHRDFIMFVIMVSLFIKMGFFLFQSYLLDLKNTKFHKLILIYYLSTPMVALILFMKFYPLLVVSPSFEICLDIAVALTMFWGTIGMIVINNLKEKTVYLNMLIMAIVVKLLQCSDFVWSLPFSIILIAGFCLNLSLYYTHYYLDRENDLSYIYTEPKGNKTAIKLVTCFYVLTGAVLFSQLGAMHTKLNMYWICFFAFLFVLSSSHLYAQIFGLFRKHMQIVKFDYRPIFILFICMLGECFMIANFENYWLYALVFVVCFVVLMIVYPLKAIVENKKLNLKLQKIDFFAHIYDMMIVNPIKIIGRWLTVLFDFMFIEKTLTAMGTSVNSFTIRVFRKFVRNWPLYYMANFVVAVLVVIYFFIKGSK